MDTNEKRQMLALLEQGRKALLDALEGVDGEIVTHLPGPGQWSILGCVEHMATSEDYLFSQIASAEPSAEPLLNAEREARMLARGTDRSRRIESPPEGHPTGRFPTLADARDHFLSSRKRTVEFVQTCQQDLRAQATWHPILGAANNYEMLISIAVHSLRHVKQIEQIKAGLA
jgi:hypothetical protein